MSENRSAEEVRGRHIAAMGAELGQLYPLLSTELTWLFWCWRQYVILFADRPSRLEILNNSAPFFFWVIQQNLWYDTLLGIARLAGPPSSAGKQNLSLKRLPPLISDQKLLTEVTDLLGKIDAQSAFASDWRNRYIAHRDLDLALKRSEPLAEASKNAVDTVLDSMAALLNAIDEHYFQSATAYRFSPTPHDAESLLYVLRDGLRREEIRQQRLEAGEYRPEDWNDDAPAV